MRFSFTILLILLVTSYHTSCNRNKRSDKKVIVSKKNTQPTIVDTLINCDARLEMVGKRLYPTATDLQQVDSTHKTGNVLAVFKKNKNLFIYVNGDSDSIGFIIKSYVRKAIKNALKHHQKIKMDTLLYEMGVRYKNTVIFLPHDSIIYNEFAATTPRQLLHFYKEDLDFPCLVSSNQLSFPFKIGVNSDFRDLKNWLHLPVKKIKPPSGSFNVILILRKQRGANFEHLTLIQKNVGYYQLHSTYSTSAFLIFRFKNNKIYHITYFSCNLNFLLKKDDSIFWFKNLLKLFKKDKMLLV